VTAWAWCGSIAAGVGVIGTWISFDRLADIERLQFREDWVADDRPYGGADARSGATLVRSGLSRISLMVSWMDHPPSWIRNHPIALRHLRRLRLFNALTMLGLLAAIAGSVLLG
jgi:hypothetical protein